MHVPVKKLHLLIIFAAFLLLAIAAIFTTTRQASADHHLVRINEVMAGMNGVRAVDHWVGERGFAGVSLRPFMIGLPPDDRRYYPIYAKCVELGVPVSVHGSANWTTVSTSRLGHPSHFDAVACDFPELKLIISHGGYPWVLEAIQLAWKHQNVYLELAAHRPRYFALPGTGWEPLLRFGPTTIADKVLFGSGWFLLGRRPAQVVEEFCALDLPAPILRKWLRENAVTLFGGQVPEASA